jgi:hypothetical protein
MRSWGKCWETLQLSLPINLMARKTRACGETVLNVRVRIPQFFRAGEGKATFIVFFRPSFAAVR